MAAEERLQEHRQVRGTWISCPLKVIAGIRVAISGRFSERVELMLDLQRHNIARRHFRVGIVIREPLRWICNDDFSNPKPIEACNTGTRLSALTAARRALQLPRPVGLLKSPRLQARHYMRDLPSGG
jgi:hypothetical protein